MLKFLTSTKRYFTVLLLVSVFGLLITTLANAQEWDRWTVDLDSDTARWTGPVDGTEWIGTYDLPLAEGPWTIGGETYYSLLDLMVVGQITIVEFETETVGLLEICANEGNTLDGDDLQTIIDINHVAWGLESNKYCTDMIPVAPGEHVIEGNSGFPYAGFTVKFAVDFGGDPMRIPELTACWVITDDIAIWSCDGDVEILPYPALTQMSRTWNVGTEMFMINQYSFTTAIVMYANMCNGSLRGPTEVEAETCGIYELLSGSYVYEFPSGLNRTASGISVSPDAPAAGSFVPAEAVEIDADVVVGTIVVNNGSTNVILRSGPGTNYRDLAVIPVGTEIVVNGRSAGGTWVNVTYVPAEAGSAESIGGWIHVDLVDGIQGNTSLPQIDFTQGG